MKELGIVDRREGDILVIEVGSTLLDVPSSEVHEAVKPGDVVYLCDGIWITDVEATASRAARIAQLMEDVWED